MKHLNERGYALFFTILSLVLISVLSISLLTLTFNSQKITTHERSDQSLYYIAEAGINLEKAKVLQVIEQIYSNLQTDITNADDEEQQAILDTYGSVEGYYAYLIEDTYCSIYNSLLDDTACDITNLSYTNSYTLDQQFSKTPNSNTEVSFECVSTQCTFTISAVGKFDGESRERQLSQNLNVTLPTYTGGDTSETTEGGGSSSSLTNPLSNYGAITKRNITLSGSSKIIGNVALLDGTIDISGGGGKRIDGSISVSDPSKIVVAYDDLNFLKEQRTAPISMNLDALLPAYPTDEATRLSQLPLPANLELKNDSNKTNIIDNGNFLATNWITDDYTYNLQQDTRFKEFKVAENNDLTLNIGNNTVNLYVDDLNIVQGHVKLQGTGTLNIYVKNSINIKGSFNDKQNPSQLNIFYEGPGVTTTTKVKGNPITTISPVVFTGETQLYGSYYSKTADLTLTGGAGFYGNIYSGGNNITISGGVPSNGQYIVAPKATLNLLEGGNIKGTVIVDNIFGSGGTSITFGDPIIPLPTLPTSTYNPIIFNDSSSYIEEKSVKEL